MRWRMRGALDVAGLRRFTVLDALLIHLQPIAGDGTAIVPAFLLAAFSTWWPWRSSRGWPGGSCAGPGGPTCRAWSPTTMPARALLVAVAAGVLVAGLANRDAADESRADFSAQSAAVRRWAAAAAPAAYRANVDRADTLKLDTDLYRTCLPGPDPKRALCVYVTTDQQPPGIRRDPSREPNASFARAGQYRP